MPSETELRPGDDLGTTLSGLDQLDTTARPAANPLRSLWSATWPKVAAASIAVGLWQLVVWLQWKPSYALAPPADAFAELWSLARDGTLGTALAITLQRAAIGFGLAAIIGSAIGSLVARVKPVRTAVGALITGIQTMPSIAWFPLAILMFQLSETAILFVTVMGAAPAIANGLITGIDHIPPIYHRAGYVLGARGLTAYRHIVLPAALPSVVGGAKQGWAFAWRSLMAGELLVILPDQPSVGFLLQINRELANSAGLIATMLIILGVGIVIDTAVFDTIDRRIRRRWGLTEPHR